MKPTTENLNDPYVIQLIAALAKQDDRIQELEAKLNAIYDEWPEFKGDEDDGSGPLTNIELLEELARQEARIKELEDGSCRFNCRTMKQAFMAGYFADPHLYTEEAAKLAYEEWRD